jgi:predicted O-methyltransferase YrrM
MDQKLPAVLIEAYRNNTVPCADGSRLGFDSNISESEATSLYQVVRTLAPEVSVEVGLAKGASTVTILQALKDIGRPALHHVLDPFQESEWKGAGLEMVRRAGLGEYMKFHQAFAEEVIPSLPAIDFAFIDASHLFDISLLEFVLCDKKLRVGGIIGFHDLWMAAQQKLLRFILTNRHYEAILPETASGSGSGTLEGILSGILSCLPFAGHLVNPKLLRPMKGARYGNLFLVRKLANDDRPTNGRHFRDF